MHQPEKSLLRTAFACVALLLALPGHAHAQDQAQDQTQTQTQTQPRTQTQTQVSSDRNVPRATANQQAAEISRGDPARWHREDRSVAERLRTIRKETAAGLQENLGNCRSLPLAERTACVREARATYTLEMAGARTRAASGN